MREPVDRSPLASYLRRHLAACGLDPSNLQHPLEIEPCSGGHSNLTDLLRFGPLELVLRRPPAGPLPPGAHDIAREFRWLWTLHPISRLVPRPYLLCDDLSIVGSVFSVMEYRSGLILRSEEPPAFSNSPELRQQVGHALVDALAEIHAIDVTGEPLAALGKPTGFVGRQVHGWSERWRTAQTSEVPELDRIAIWLRDHLPPEPAVPAIVHGDFKLDNLVLDPARPGRVTAVLDWEMSALGDPLVDLGVLLTYWGPTAPPASAPAPFTDRAGWPTRDALLERYVRRSGRDLSRIVFYEVLGLFKVAVVIQQIFSRFARGHATDARFAGFDARVAFLARRATERLASG